MMGEHKIKFTFFFYLFLNSFLLVNRIPQPTDNFVELTSIFAVSTGSIGADLQQIPNQPTVFVVK